MSVNYLSFHNNNIFFQAIMFFTSVINILITVSTNNNTTPVYKLITAQFIGGDKKKMIDLILTEIHMNIFYNSIFKYRFNVRFQ